MKQLTGVFSNVSMDSAANYLDESSTPRIVRNIERVSIRYREYIKSETDEELNNETEQKQKIKELRKKDPKASK